MAHPATDIPVMWVAFSTAGDLARYGDFDRAIAVLETVGVEQRNFPEGLDLLARIRAQRAEYDAAERLWMKAVEIAPAEASYRKALDSVKRLKKSRFARVLAAPTFRVSAALVVLVMVGLTGFVSFRSGVTAVTSNEGPPAAATPRALQDFTMNLPGFESRSKDSEITLVPDSGLFRSGSAYLSERARVVLSRFATRLGPDNDGLRIEIVGYTDDVSLRDTSRFADNRALGMARALATYDFLTRSERLNPSHMSIASLGEYAPPFSGSDLKSAARNRTVTLRLSRP